MPRPDFLDCAAGPETPCLDPSTSTPPSFAAGPRRRSLCTGPLFDPKPGELRPDPRLFLR